VKKLLPFLMVGLIIVFLVILPRIKTDTKPKTIQMPVMIQVEIRGAIHMPGVYEVVEGTTLETLIDYAMGVHPAADLQTLNLTTPLTDGVKYVIPYKNQDESSSKININQATLEQLMTLPGIGKVTAQKIIDFRVQSGPFMRIEDIQLVSGIGAQTFEQIKALITL
jgi:competence protein ComEA